MSYTPVELRHVRVGRSLLGYNRKGVEQVISEVAESFEATWRERGELADQVENLQKQVEDLRRREELLTNTLVAAEKAAGEVRDQAKRRADEILRDAAEEARMVTRSAQSERDRLLVETRRIEAMLRAALGMVEGDAPIGVDTPVGIVESVSPTTFKRDDTNEFEPIRLPPIDETVIEEGEPQPVGGERNGHDSLGFDWGR